MPGRKKPVAPIPEPTEWRLTWGEESWTADDLIGADLGALAQLLGNEWAQLSPTIGPLHLMSFLTVLVTRSSGADFDEVRKAIGSSKATELLGALTFE